MRFEHGIEREVHGVLDLRKIIGWCAVADDLVCCSINQSAIKNAIPTLAFGHALFLFQVRGWKDVMIVDAFLVDQISGDNRLSMEVTGTSGATKNETDSAAINGALTWRDVPNRAGSNFSDAMVSGVAPPLSQATNSEKSFADWLFGELSYCWPKTAHQNQRLSCSRLAPNSGVLVGSSFASTAASGITIV